MLYFVGLGLFDEKDLSLRGLEVLRKSDKVCAEFYTSFYGGRVSDLEKLIGKKVTVLRRVDVEERPEETVLEGALHDDVSLLVCGDPLVATTHADLMLRARRKGVKTVVVHASSVYSAVAETGLQLYKFGKTTTLPFPEKGYKPTSPYDAIAENKSRGLHTLVLLDVKEEEGKYMTVSEGVELLLKMEEKKKKRVLTEETMLVGAARLGGADAKIAYGSAKKLMKEDFGPPPHILVVPGKLHYMEEEYLSFYTIEPTI